MHCAIILCLKQTHDCKEAVHVFRVCPHSPTLNFIQGPIICLKVCAWKRKTHFFFFLFFNSTWVKANRFSCHIFKICLFLLEGKACTLLRGLQLMKEASATLRRELFLELVFSDIEQSSFALKNILLGDVLRDILPWPSQVKGLTRWHHCPSKLLASPQAARGNDRAKLTVPSLSEHSFR